MVVDKSAKNLTLEVRFETDHQGQPVWHDLPEDYVTRMTGYTAEE